MKDNDALKLSLFPMRLMSFITCHADAPAITGEALACVIADYQVSQRAYSV